MGYFYLEFDQAELVDVSVTIVGAVAAFVGDEIAPFIIDEGDFQCVTAAR